MKKQSYSNHKKYDPYYHGLLYTLVISIFIASIINIIEQLDEPSNLLEAYILTGLSVVAIIITILFRYYAVRLQDRIIRMEENFRHFQLAPDAEFPALCKEAVDKHMTNEEIKKAISRWRVIITAYNHPNFFKRKRLLSDLNFS
ncbi:MAG: hypothetical protein IPP51_17070 [Bacteroidetes bacterium]|nr:hypothetical protein [Bacteroidota bacterium]